MVEDERQRELSLRGIVVPTEWDSRGKALRVAILTPDEQQYDVADTIVGRQLTHVLREEIQASVHLDSTHGREQLVTVRSFVVIDSLQPDNGTLISNGRADNW